MDHELVHLAQRIDWDEVENEFKEYFSENGRPSVPVRKMVGLMLLKSLYNRSDEGMVAHWIESPYFQYSTGEYVFQIKPPTDPAEKLLKLSIKVNADEISGDTKVGIPGKDKSTDSYYKRTEAKNNFRRRACITALIAKYRNYEGFRCEPDKI